MGGRAAGTHRLADRCARVGQGAELSRRRRGDAGAAVVEFVLVGALLTFLFLLVLQVGFALHARNVLIASAAEGARHAANADRSAVDGEQHARRLVAQSLSPQLAGRMSYSAAQTTGAGDIPLVEVTIRGPVPLVFLPAGPITVTARGHAVEEQR